MSRKKLFLENIFIYGLGSVLSKIIPLIMLPIITSIMTDSYYFGINDLQNVLVSFGCALAIMGMYDSMFRLFFDKDSIEYQKTVCSSALVSVIISGSFLMFLLIIFKSWFSFIIFNTSEMVLLIVLAGINIFAQTLQTIVSAPTKMRNKRKTLIVVNLIAPIIGYLVSIPLLINGKYLIALPISSLITSVILLFIFYFLNNKWFTITNFKVEIIIKMLKLGLPLVPTFIIYWVFNSFDRFMISKMLGAEFTGIYGIGAKVASISYFIYTAFSKGWVYFNYSTMKDKDHIALISKIYEYLALISSLSIIMLLPFVVKVFQILFSGDYVNGYIVFPYLFLSPLCLMLFQVVSSQFLVKNISWPISLTLLLGVIADLILNYLLIPLLGIEGAAISTLTGYLVSIIIITIVGAKLKMIIVSRKIIWLFVITAIIFVFFRLFLDISLMIKISIGLAGILFIIFIYKSEIKSILKIKNWLS